MLAVVMTMMGRVNRSMEIQSNLSSVLEEALQELCEKKKYSAVNEQEIVDDLIKYLAIRFDSES